MFVSWSKQYFPLQIVSLSNFKTNVFSYLKHPSIVFIISAVIHFKQYLIHSLHVESFSASLVSHPPIKCQINNHLQISESLGFYSPLLFILFSALDTTVDVIVLAPFITSVKPEPVNESLLFSRRLETYCSSTESGFIGEVL